MSSDSSTSQENLFQHRRTRAKSTQSVFFWLFRIATYFILAAATYLFLDITVQGSITLFSTKAPFINISFLTDRPQTLYVFQWDDESLTGEQLAAVSEVEAEIREELSSRQAAFEAEMQDALQKKPERKAELKQVNQNLNRLKGELEKLTKDEEKLNQELDKLEKNRRRIYARDQRDPELEPMQVEVDDILARRTEVFDAQAVLKKQVTELTAQRNELQAGMPSNVKKEYRRIIGNMEAALAWPEEGFFEEQNAAESRIHEKYDAKAARLNDRFEGRIAKAEASRATDLQERLEKELADLETEREAKIRKAQSIEVGDVAYRGVYARKVDAAGLSPQTYSYSGGGIFPAIAGTVLLVIGSMIIALTLGIFSAIFLSEYAKPGTVLNLIRLSILNLAGVPSIVFGLFGLGMFVLFLDWNVSLLAGCFTLAFMVLPVIITASEESLRSIPQGFREGSLALGATKWTSIRTNVLPYALPGILTSSVLGVARVAGETAPIMFTAAYALRDNLPWEGLDNPFQFFFQGVMALPYHIYVVSSKIPQNEYTIRMQYGTAFVFLMIVAGIALTSILLRIRMRKKYKW